MESPPPNLGRRFHESNRAGDGYCWVNAVKIGLRIDADTFRGTRDGLPALYRILRQRSIRASFFFTVGPDNMGRHLLRLARPKFAAKMLRTRAARLYGWDILRRGTLGPGPVIGRRLADTLRQASREGHETGVHAWDHHAWQMKLDGPAIATQLQRAVELLTALGVPPVCSAAPGWRCDDQVLLIKQRFDFTYNSDCRGQSLFLPMVNGRVLRQPQVPVTLPTYDEVVGCGGRRGVTDRNYNDHLLGLLEEDSINVLVVHAEVEGIHASAMFESFLDRAAAMGAAFVPLGDLVRAQTVTDVARIVQRSLPTRDGPVACQESQPAEAPGSAP